MRRLAVVVAVLLVAGVFGGLDDDAADPDRAPTSPAASPGTTSTKPSTTRRPPRPPTAEPRPTRRPDRPSYVVTRVVDGDTLELGNGETVRLVGIDTPEVGECGYETASDALARLVLGRQVRLGASEADRDRYGRLLRYVDVPTRGGTLDAGLRLVRRGLAAARYDSRDGYGRHPREDAYIRADRRSPPSGCARPAPLLQQPAGRCAPGYRPCVPPYPPDVDCADVAGPVSVTGPDPHALDADGDGTACE